MAITWKGGCGKGGGGIYTPGPGIQISDQNEISADVRRDMITVPEVSPSETAHAVGEYLIFNNGLYRVTAAIAVGDELVSDTNIVQTSVGAELNTVLPDKYNLVDQTPGRSVELAGPAFATNYYNDNTVVMLVAFPFVAKNTDYAVSVLEIYVDEVPSIAFHSLSFKYNAGVIVRASVGEVTPRFGARVSWYRMNVTFA